MYNFLMTIKLMLSDIKATFILMDSISVHLLPICNFYLILNNKKHFHCCDLSTY